MLVKGRATEEATLKAFPEETSLGESGTNGEIESVREEVEGCGLMRSVRSDMQHTQLAHGLPHPVLSWLPTHVADVISR